MEIYATKTRFHVKLKSIFLCFIILIAFGTCAYAGTTSTSGVTAQTIIDRARADVAERVTDFWTDGDFIQWINEAVKEIVYQTRCLETGTSTIVLQDSTRYYPLSGITFLDIEKVEYDSGVTWITVSSGVTKYDPLYIYDLDRARFINLREGKEKETGKPKVFAVWNNNIYFWPIPDISIAGTTTYVYYVPLPSGITSATSAIETPSYFDSAILDYVRAQAWYKAEYVKRAQYFEARFLSRIRAYLVNVLRRNLFELPQPVQQ